MNLIDLLTKIFVKLEDFGEIIFVLGIISLIRRVIDKDSSTWFFYLAIFMILLGLELIVTRNVRKSEDNLKEYIDNSLERLESKNR